MKFYDIDTEFTFGKYEGKTIKEVFEKDPKYIDFCLNNIDEFYVSPSVLKELKSISNKVNLSLDDDQDDDILDSFYEDAEEVDEFEEEIDADNFDWEDEDLGFDDDDLEAFDDFEDDFR